MPILPIGPSGRRHGSSARSSGLRHHGSDTRRVPHWGQRRGPSPRRIRCRDRAGPDILPGCASVLCLPDAAVRGAKIEAARMRGISGDSATARPPRNGPTRRHRRPRRAGSYAGEAPVLSERAGRALRRSRGAWPCVAAAVGIVAAVSRARTEHQSWRRKEPIGAPPRCSGRGARHAAMPMA
jgi:hypothetical protein